jgi:hypothetical protein
VIPYDCWEGATPDEIKQRQANGQWRWGIITVVMLDSSKPGEEPKLEASTCCSHGEGDYKTRADVEVACAASKQYHEDRLNDALALLETLTSQAWKLAGVTLSDLVALREQLAENRPTCSVPLCFEKGCTTWLVDDEQEACLCEAHLKGKKILTFKGVELVFESWAQINKAEGVTA